MERFLLPLDEMAQESKKKTQPKPESPRKIPGSQPPGRPFLPLGQRSRWGWLFWVFLLVIVIGYVMFQSRAAAAPQIAYSDFKSLVQKGQVAAITIKGQEISGTFKSKQEIKTVSGETKKDVLSFKTIKPTIEDPELITLLQDNGVTVKGQVQGGNQWLGTLLILGLPWLLILGYFVYARRKAQGQVFGRGGLFGVGMSPAKRYTRTMSRTTFDDVAGLENAKKDLEEIIDYLKNPGRFMKMGADIPKGILLVGPPGTGKTLLARATAGEADVPFFSISASEFIEMFVGVGASRVRDLFATAKKEAPSIIFIDELDSVGRTRGTGLGGGHDEREQTLNQILSEMDGFEPHQSVIVLSATNRPDVLDPALIRPGRFDREITLDMPRKHARQKILRIHTRRVPLAPEVDLENLAARTVGFSGADLKNLVNEAALLAARQNEPKVTAADFDMARDKVILGQKREEMLGEDEKKITAYHEAGHALASWLLPGADPLQKVTIIPRGLSLGATEQAPAEDRYTYTETYLLQRVAILLSGRAAEKLVFKDISSGASDDLKKATQLVRRMVTQWGMSERLGPVTFSWGEEHPFLGKEMATPRDFSEETARIVDEEIQRIVKEQEDKAARVLKEHQDDLEKLAAELLKHETLEKQDIQKILGKPG
jgi:cell division protease FtsH